MNRSFRIKAATVYERFGDETVIVNLDSGNYYSAQDVASWIWTLVSDGVSQASILRHATTEFTGNSGEILHATSAFLDQLVEELLVDPEPTADADGEQAEGESATPSKVFVAPLLLKYTDMEEMLLLDPIHEVDGDGWPSARRPVA